MQKRTLHPVLKNGKMSKKETKRFFINLSKINDELDRRSSAANMDVISHKSNKSSYFNINKLKKNLVHLNR